MSKIEQLQEGVTHLTPAERATFAEWFEEFQEQEWDRQMEADVAAGKWDKMAAKALADHCAGRSRQL